MKFDSVGKSQREPRRKFLKVQVPNRNTINILSVKYEQVAEEAGTVDTIQ